MARAKHKEGNSRSKSVNDLGNSFLIAAKLVSRSAIFGIFKSSQIRARISKDWRWGWRRLRRLAMLLTIWFIVCYPGQIVLVVRFFGVLWAGFQFSGCNHHVPIRSVKEFV